MIEAVFDLGDTIAREVMVPRPDVVTVRELEPRHCCERELHLGSPSSTRRLMNRSSASSTRKTCSKRSRPRTENGGQSGEDSADEPTARNLARDVIIVPETRRIDEVLADFRRQNVQLAVVIDEWVPSREF